MKYIACLLLLISQSALAGLLYHKSYNSEGREFSVEETERGTDYSIVRTSINDAQGGPLAIVRAAAVIGDNLNKTYFTLISGNKREDGYYFKLFFTSDAAVDPQKRFPGEMSQEQITTFKETGYLAVKNYRESAWTLPSISGIWKHSEKPAWLELKFKNGIGAITVARHGWNPDAEGLVVLKDITKSKTDTDHPTWRGKMFDAKQNGFIPAILTLSTPDTLDISFEDDSHPEDLHLLRSSREDMPQSEG